MNTQQKLERVIRKARTELSKLKAVEPTSLKSGVDNLKSYLESKAIVKAFGKAEIVETVEATYTKKDNTTIPILKATLSNGKVFNVTPERFWLNK